MKKRGEVNFVTEGHLSKFFAIRKWEEGESGPFVLALEAAAEVDDPLLWAFPALLETFGFFSSFLNIFACKRLRDAFRCTDEMIGEREKRKKYVTVKLSRNKKERWNRLIKSAQKKAYFWRIEKLHIFEDIEESDFFAHLKVEYLTDDGLR